MLELTASEGRERFHFMEDRLGLASSGEGLVFFYDYFVCLGCGCIFMFLKMILLDSLYSNTHTHAKEQTQIETSKHTNDTR